MSVATDDTWTPEPDDWPDDDNVVPIRRARRAAPHDLDAERHLLASIVLGTTPPGAVDPDIWWAPRHAAVHTAAAALHDNGHAVSIETVEAQMRAGGADIEAAWWVDLAAAAVSPAKADTLAAQLAALHLARRLASDLHDAGEEALASPLDSARILGDTIARLGTLEPPDPTGLRLAAVGDDMEAWIDLFDRRCQGDTDGIPTGLDALDTMIGGLHGGQLIVIGARPAVGKTAFALNLADTIASTGVPVAFISIEMSRLELQDRLVAMHARVDGRRIRNGTLGHVDGDKVARAVGELANMPLTIADDPQATLGSIRADAVKAGVGDGVGVVFVDYLQLIHHRADSKSATRQEVVAEVARGLKRLARVLGVPVVALSQMSREVRHRADKRPTLFDMRESGQIEQDADVAIGLHREELFDADTSDKGVLEAIVLKQRNGPTGTARLAFMDRWGRVVNMREGL